MIKFYGKLLKNGSKKFSFARNHFLRSPQLRLVKKTPIRFFSDQEQKISQESSLKKSKGHKHEFKTETKKILHIVAHSLYTDKDVFLRELLSNCSDALEKQRIQDLRNSIANEDPLQINIITNEDSNQLIIQDTGIGMDEEELIENLGTIASSGSKKFIEEMEKQNMKDSAENLIGQFGVGFYSSFIVGDTVEVFSKKGGEAKAHCWTSDGSGSYEITEVENFDISRGTKIVVHLKPEYKEFCQPENLKKIINKYSNFIQHPIFLNHEKINIIEAIWAQNKSQVTAEQYQNFYEYIAHSKSKFQFKLHYQVEIPLNIKAILFAPQVNPEQLGLNSIKPQVDLYCRRVLIKKGCEGILPNYLRFISGVVDCEDLPLNISRENYQDSNLMMQLRKVMTKRVLKMIEEEAKKNPEEYNEWFRKFNLFFKEGLHQDKDNSEALLRLSRYDSSIKQNISLDEYLSQMKKDQNKIYYFLAPSQQQAKISPYMESYLEHEIPVLYISINIEEMLFMEIQNYKGFEFANIESANTTIPDKLLKEELKVDKETIPTQDQEGFSMWIRSELQPVVSNVKISKNLQSSPVLLISQMTTGTRQMLAMMQPEQIEELSKNMTLEINPTHKMILDLNKLRKVQPQKAADLLKQILDSCLLSTGIPFNTQNFVNRTYNFIQNDLKTLLNDSGKNNEEEVSQIEIEENLENEAEKAIKQKQAKKKINLD